MAEHRSPIRTRQITIPEHVWGRLASIADDRGTTIEELLVHAIESIAEPKTHLEQRTTRERVVAMVLDGHADASIAAELHIFVQRVAEIRRKAKLPANNYGRGGGGTRRKIA